MLFLKVKKKISVAFSDGTSLTRKVKKIDDMDSLMEAIEVGDENAVRSIMDPQIESRIAAQNTLASYADSPYMEVRGDSVVIPSVSEMTVPKTLADAILASGDNVQRYLKFWRFCCMNADSRVRTNIFWFLDHWGMKISENGLLVAYRRVVPVKKTKLQTFVIEQYERIRRNKKSPKKYGVYHDGSTGEYLLSHHEDYRDGLTGAGSLYHLYQDYKNLPNSEYTDKYTGTTEINIGGVVEIAREDCDPDQDNTCSRGLHAGSKGWMESKGNRFGSEVIRVLINPADVVSIPFKDSYGKLRCCRYYADSVITFRGGQIVDEVLLDDNYITIIEDELNPDLENSFEHTIEIPKAVEFCNVDMSDQLTDLKAQITSRVEQVYEEDDDENLYPDY